MARLQDFQTVTPSGSNNLLIVQSQGQGLSTVDAVGQKIATDTNMSSLNTSSKKIIGAINEVYSASAIRYNLGYGKSLSTTKGRNHWLCLLSSELYLVWFYSTSSLAVRNIGTNSQVIGSSNTATLGNYTFTRGTNNILTITSTSDATMTIFG